MVNAVGNLSHVYASNYVDMARNEEVTVAERVPDFSSASGLEDFVLGGGVVDNDGELIAGVPKMEVVDLTDKKDERKIYSDVDKVFGALGYNLSGQAKYVGESKNDYDIYDEVRKASQKSKILSYSFVREMFPIIVDSIWGSGNLIDSLFGAKKGDGGLMDILNSISKLNQNLVDFQNSMEHGRISESDYSGYLERNSSELRELAGSIVSEYGAVTQDEKAYAVRDWVQKNLEYITDMKHHGVGEKWSKPTETLRDLLADCEDGGFLSAGLAHHAGIDDDNSRFVAGIVKAGAGAATGGHGWWIYKRESDDEWVPMDWCYLPNQKEINDITPIRNDSNYITDWFVVMGNGLTIDTGAVNTVRNPDALDRWDNYSSSRNRIALGEFRTTGQELLAAHKYIANQYLEQGLDVPGIMKDGGNTLFFLMEMQKRMKEGNVLDLQKKVSEGFSEFMSADDYLEARAS